MLFRVLGPVDVVRSGTSVPIAGERQRAVLAMLLLSRDEVVSTERLIDALWGADPPASAAHGIEVAVSNLRRQLSHEVVRTRPPGYLVPLAAGDLDVDLFGALVAGSLGDEVVERARAAGRIAISMFAAEVHRELRLATSTRVPSASERSAARPATARTVRPGCRSTSRSMRPASSSSSRAADPYTRTFRAPFCRASRRIVARCSSRSLRGEPLAAGSRASSSSNPQACRIRSSVPAPGCFRPLS